MHEEILTILVIVLFLLNCHSTYKLYKIKKEYLEETNKRLFSSFISRENRE